MVARAFFVHLGGGFGDESTSTSAANGCCFQDKVDLIQKKGKVLSSEREKKENKNSNGFGKEEVNCAAEAPKGYKKDSLCDPTSEVWLLNQKESYWSLIESEKRMSRRRIEKVLFNDKEGNSLTAERSAEPKIIIKGKRKVGIGFG
ncbi:uncharacterized protein LOC127240894 [Andrographis paniculata]|uniref:uncharacterized protein LOC127240894 n=1 Tax=Andrographis paniculata TaxID=175694 RepID=UPI0021E8F2D1|nr:uncharacterized protein LOC127240894 [Andrographis paniculata]